MKKHFARWLPASVLGLALATSTAFAGFQVQGGKLVEGNGTPFVMRGVSHAHVWYTGTTQQAIRDIASTGANTIRFVVSDGHHSGSRTSGADLAQMIRWCKESKLIAMFEVHDATGFGDDASAEDPLSVVNYWLSSDVRQALDGQEDYVIINPANEPIGNNRAGDWTAMQKQTVQRLRAAGVKHNLLLDAPNWGQDWSNTMRNNAQQVFDADPQRNTIFGVHMYESYGSASVVQGYYQDFKNKNLALVVGEFGADHKGAAVDEDAIMAGAQQHGFGYLGWSWSGNNAETKSLDIANSFNVNSLSSWGNRLINGANGIKQTSKLATIYCTTHCGTSSTASSAASSQGPLNLAFNKPASATSTEGAGFEASKISDGNGATRWASALTAATADVTVDLGGFYNINGMRLSWEAAFAKGYTIQVSSDNLNWSDLFSKTTGTGGVENLSLTGQGRYIRVHMTAKANTAWGYSLWEVEVFGGPTNPPSSSAWSSPASSVRSSTPVIPSSSASSVTNPSAFGCSMKQTGSWQGGGQFDGTLKNNGAGVSSWTVYLTFSQAVQGLSVWNAAVTQISASKYKLTNVSWNGNLGAGAATGFGMTANFSGSVTASCSGSDGGSISSVASSVPNASSSMTLSSRATSSIALCGQSPADPLANTKVKNLLCYLKTNSYISGQTDLADGDYVKSMTGRYPAIIAFDFYNYTDGYTVGNTSETQKAIDWARSKKGIVAFQWHWKCPRGGGKYDGNCDFDQDLNNPNSALYQNIDLVVKEIKKMGDAGVPVLFRPLHEANNNYMWWAKKGQDNYKKLWVLIYNRAQLAGAHNIIWVFNGMASGQGTSLASWYPGDQYADVVSSDYFQSWSDFNTCKAVGNNKVVAIAETFNQLDPAKDPAWSFSVVWASRDWSGKGAEQSWRTAMANPKTIAIDQLPDMFNWTDGPSSVASSAL